MRFSIRTLFLITLLFGILFAGQWKWYYDEHFWCCGKYAIGVDYGKFTPFHYKYKCGTREIIIFNYGFTEHERDRLREINFPCYSYVSDCNLHTNPRPKSGKYTNWDFLPICD